MASFWRCCILALCLTQTLAADDECDIHMEDGKYLYRIQFKQQPEQCECESWMNETDYVLANCVGKDSRWILKNTKTFLLASKCIETVIYRCHCKKYISVICTANCTESTFQDDNTEGYGFLIPLLIFIVGLLLVVLVIAVLCYWKKRRNRQRREGAIYGLATSGLEEQR